MPRKDGRIEPLAGCDATTIEAGEAIAIVTPTAGVTATNRTRCAGECEEV